MPEAERAERRFELSVDSQAAAWLEAHAPAKPLVIDYAVHHCCGGGKICEVRVREHNEPDADYGNYSVGTLSSGAPILIDQRAAARLPSHFGLTVTGRGRRARLDLSLDGEQWGDLLYT